MLTAFRVKAMNKYTGKRLTVFYSHPNAIDLGDVLPLGVDFAKTFGCDFVSYDYTGYGPNIGDPSEGETTIK